MGIGTYLTVVFWWSVGGLVVRVFVMVAADYPRKSTTSLGADVVTMLLSIFMFAWVCYLRATST